MNCARDDKGLLNRLRALSKEFPIEKYYDWDIPDDCPIEVPAGSNYDRNVYLKCHLAPTLKGDNSKQLDIHFWIIQRWGGINTFKKNKKNIDRIIKFKKELDNKSISRDSFKVIPSLSKIASFIDPNNFSIYDARTAAALNWLILNHSTSDLLLPKRYGRNKKVEESKKRFKKELLNPGLNREYKTIRAKGGQTDAYHRYCEFLKCYAPKVFGDDSPPYKLEMLLFTLAIKDAVEKR